MELRVETLPGCSLPNGCYIGVRVGEVSKQGRYDPLCCYRFPPLERQRNAKIDLYQHLGTCSAVVDPETRDNEVSISASEPGLNNVRLKVSTRPELAAKPTQERKTTPFKKQAKEYLGRHRIEDRLSAAVKAMLAGQPEDPTEFLVAHLRESCPNAKTASVGSSHPREDATDVKQAAATPATTACSNAASAAAPLAAVTPETSSNAPSAALPVAASEDATSAAVPPAAPEAGSPGAVFASLHASATVAGLPALIESFRDATVGEVAKCLSGVAPAEREKLEKVLELLAQQAAALKIQKIGRGKAARRKSAQLKAAPSRPASAGGQSLLTLIESLKSATMEEVAECLSGVPPGELQTVEKDAAPGKLEKDAGKVASSSPATASGQPLLAPIASLKSATIEEVAECLSGLPPGALQKLEKVAALPKSEKDAGLGEVEQDPGVPPGGLKQLEKGAGLDPLMESFGSVAPDAIVECLFGVPRSVLEKLEKVVVQEIAMEAATLKIQAVGRGNAARKKTAQSKVTADSKQVPQASAASGQQVPVDELASRVASKLAAASASGELAEAVTRVVEQQA